ncbi:hypothetical protein C8Q77DRAFT_460829 [Trametes polyzona]|nr:hypothetical protein C8Q77DRAFT_460829 [Trametes polyzona]
MSMDIPGGRRFGAGRETPPRLLSRDGWTGTRTGRRRGRSTGVVARDAFSTQVPSCALECVSESEGASRCDSGDVACLCTSAAFLDFTIACVEDACSAEDESKTATALDVVCAQAPPVVSDSSSTGATQSAGQTSSRVTTTRTSTSVATSSRDTTIIAAGPTTPANTAGHSATSSGTSTTSRTRTSSSLIAGGDTGSPTGGPDGGGTGSAASSSSSSTRHTTTIIAALSAVVALMVVASMFGACVWWKRRKRRRSRALPVLDPDPITDASGPRVGVTVSAAAARLGALGELKQAVSTPRRGSNARPGLGSSGTEGAIWIAASERAGSDDAVLGDPSSPNQDTHANGENGTRTGVQDQQIFVSRSREMVEEAKREGGSGRATNDRELREDTVSPNGALQVGERAFPVHEVGGNVGLWAYDEEEEPPPYEPQG